MVAGIGDVTYSCPGMYLLTPSEGYIEFSFETDCGGAGILTHY